MKLGRHLGLRTRVSNLILFEGKRLPKYWGVPGQGRLDLANKMRCDKIDFNECGEKHKLCSYLFQKNVKNGYIPLVID